MTGNHICSAVKELTHWGRMTHICVGKLTIIGLDNGLSPERRQAIIWTNTRILLIWPLGTNFNEILKWIKTFSFTKMHLKMSSAKWCPFCLGLNVLKANPTQMPLHNSQSFETHQNPPQNITSPPHTFTSTQSLLTTNTCVWVVKDYPVKKGVSQPDGCSGGGI